MQSKHSEIPWMIIYFPELWPSMKVQKSIGIFKQHVQNCATNMQSCLNRNWNVYGHVDLEIEFESEATPMFMKPRPVPFTIQQNLTRTYETGIARGIGTPI